MTDLQIFNFEGTASDLLLDVSVTSSIKFCQNGAAMRPVNTMVIGRPAEKCHLSKVKKYRDVCNVNGFGFKPIVFESNGFMHHDTLAFFKSIAKRISEYKRIPHETIFRFFMKNFSIRLNLDISKSIHTNISTISTAGVVDNALLDHNIFVDGLPVRTD